MPARSLSRYLAAGLVFALLFAQGLRVCLHVPATSQAPGVAAASHLESAFSAADVDDDNALHAHATVVGLLKSFAAKLPLVALLAATFALLLVSPQTVRRVRAYDSPIPPGDGHRLTPPLRAPPR